MNPAYIELRRLSCSYGDVRAVDDLCLELFKGELFVLLGPSGCGKTTTLRLLAGLEAPSGGDVVLDGRSLNGMPARQRNVAMVFQDHTLYPHMRIRKNLGFSLRMHGLPRREIRERVAGIAHLLGIERQLELWPRQLSGGEAQRVALGKALVRRPDLLLLDEPLSSLDAPLRRRLREEIVRVQRRYGITTVYVTHDQEEAMALGGRMGIMDRGRLLQTGTPTEIYTRPSCTFAARFLGSPPVNLLPGRVDDDRRVWWECEGGEEIVLPGEPAGGRGLLPGRAVWVGIRPEDILVSARRKAPTDVTGNVEFARDMGFEHHLVVTCAGRSLRLRCAHLPRGVHEGAAVYLRLEPEKMMLFDRETGTRCAGG